MTIKKQALTFLTWVQSSRKPAKDLMQSFYFPQAGPDTEKAWIKAAQDAKMHMPS